MPTLVIRVVLVQLFGLVGQSGKVDGSFAPTRASSTADSQLAIHPSHLRVYSQIKTQACSHMLIGFYRAKLAMLTPKVWL